MAWTKEMYTTLFEITAVSSSLSVAGSLFILGTLFTFPEARKGVSKLLLWLSVSDLFGSLSFLVGAGHTLNGGNWLVDTELCQIQGGALQMFSLSTALWSLFIGVHLYRSFMLRRHNDLEKTMKYYHLVAWGLSIILAIVGGVAGLYGPAGGWCWITSATAANKVYQQVFFYMFVYMVFLALAALYVRIGVEIYTTMKETAATLEYSVRTRKRQVKKRDKVLGKMFFFPAVFLVTWLPGIINRMHGLTGNPPVYGLFVGHVLFTPLQGFLNAIVYGLTGNIGRLYMRKMSTVTSNESATNSASTSTGKAGGRSMFSRSGNSGGDNSGGAAQNAGYSPASVPMKDAASNRAGTFSATV